MKRFLLLCCAAVLGAAQVQAQDGDFTMQRFFGGDVQVDYRLGINLTGTGLGSGTMGGVLSTRVGDHAASLFGNPAELGRMRHPQVVLSTRLGLNTDLYGLDGTQLVDPVEIETRTDEALADFSFPASATPVYTKVENIYFGETNQLAGMVAAIPFHPRVTLAFGFAQPLDVNLRLRASGIETLLEAAQESGDQTITIDVLTQLNAAAQFRSNINTLSFGGGGRVYDGPYGRVDLGLAGIYYSVTNRLSWDINPQGLVILSGSQEYYYNDPEDPNLNRAAGESNNLYFRARGNYTDSAWGFRAGLIYKPTRWFDLSLTYNHVPAFRLDDPDAFAESFVPTYVNLEGKADAGPDEEDLLVLDSLNLAKPNLTKQTSDSLGQRLGFKMPSSLTLGMDFAMGQHTFALNLVRYWGELTFSGTYGDRGGTRDPFRVGKDADYGLKYGFDFKFPDRFGSVTSYALLPIRLLFLDFDGILLQALGKWTHYTNPHYRFGGGFILGGSILERTSETVEDGLRDVLALPFPTGFSLGRQYSIFHDIDIGITTIAIPDLLLRLTIAYNVR